MRLPSPQSPPLREVARGLYAVSVRQSTTYLVDRDALVIIDTGAPGSAPTILRALETLGHRPSQVAAIVLTHAHLDHVGSLRELQRWIDAPTVAHAADAALIASPEALPNPFQHPAAAAVSGPLLRRLDPGPAAVHVFAEDGDPIPGTRSMRIFHMPGHTPGSIALFDDDVVIVGDAMERRRGRLGPPSRLFTQDMPAAHRSIRRLATLDFDTLCLSHFDPIQGEASLALRQFAATLRG